MKVALRTWVRARRVVVERAVVRVGVSATGMRGVTIVAEGERLSRKINGYRESGRKGNWVVGRRL